MSTPPAASGGTEPRGAIVVGAGLAGLVTALRLEEKGVEVELLEAAGRPGGKAGSDLLGGEGVAPYPSDHGYHVFPAWYTNTWTLIDELGIGDDFQRRKHFFRLRKHRAARLKRDGWRLWLASHPMAMMFPRSLLAGVQLVAMTEDEVGDQSLAEFLCSRPYGGPRMGHDLRDISLKGLGNPAKDASALTFRANMRLLLPVLFTRPNWTAAKGSLQHVFIDPLVRRIEAAIATGTRVVALDVAGAGADFTVQALVTSAGRIETEGRPVVLALPHGQVHDLLKGHGPAVPEELQGLCALTSRPMVALDVHLKRTLQGFPKKGHVILDGSRFHLTALDLRPVWPAEELPGEHTVLQVIAADVGEDVRQGGRVVAEVLADLLAFFPYLKDEIVEVVPHVNEDAPLFMNTPGGEAARPSSDRVYGTNLLVAGDWCRTPISLACMEGAVVSGTLAARTILRRHDLADPQLSLPSTEASRKAKLIAAVAQWPIRALGALVDLVPSRLDRGDGP